MNEKIKILIYGLIGALVGSTFPISMIILDMKELEMAFNIKNFSWVSTSQNALLFSLFAVPAFFSIIAILFLMFNKKKNELLSTQKIMNKMAHAAGMAEIASEVIHNIGNILTAVFIYSDKIKMTIEASKYKSAEKAALLLDQKMEILKDHADKDEELSKLLEYFKQYGINTVKEYDKIDGSIKELKRSVYTIRDILIAQQSVASSASFIEEITVEDLISNAMSLLSDKVTKYGVDFKVNITGEFIIRTEKSKVINILCNLIKNSIEALDSNQELETKIVTISSRVSNSHVFIDIKDNGEGIPKENLGKIFNHGFTTKDSGSGFGLHSCKNLAKSIEGDLTVDSKGKGDGAVFTLELPVNRSAHNQTEE